MPGILTAGLDSGRTRGMRSFSLSPVLVNSQVRIGLLLPVLLLLLAGDAFSAGQNSWLPPSDEQNPFLREVKAWSVFLGPILPTALLFLVAAGLDVYIASRPGETVRRQVKTSTVLKLVAGVLIALFAPWMWMVSEAPDKDSFIPLGSLAIAPLTFFLALGLFLGAGLAGHALAVRRWYMWWGLYLLGVIIARQAEVFHLWVFLASVPLVFWGCIKGISDSSVQIIHLILPSAAAEVGEGEGDDKPVIWPSADEPPGEDEDPGWFVGEEQAADSEQKTGRKAGKKRAKKKSRKKQGDKDAEKQTASAEKPAKKKTGRKGSRK